MDIQRPNRISASSNQATAEKIETAPLFESRNPAMLALLGAARSAAVADTTVLLTGESGTGKDVLARQIHRWSPRRDGPFVMINCATLTEELLENELFGHVRGAFSGAVSDSLGRLEAGDGGTVLFDEIAELRPSLQAKLLRFTHDHSFERIGSNRTIIISTRIIAASNRNLEAEVTAGRFREDLYYRLNVIAFRLPPLRERTQDILPLAQRLLKQISFKIGRPALALSEKAVGALTAYRWPGNLRELHNVLEHAATLARTKIIKHGDLPDSIIGHPRNPAARMFVPPKHGTRLEDLEREHIMRVLAESRTLEQAAATLGINLSTLWRKRKRYNLKHHSWFTVQNNARVKLSRYKARQVLRG
jgi:two-component system, NtrC family, response regulator AlgB